MNGGGSHDSDSRSRDDDEMMMMMPMMMLTMMLMMMLKKKTMMRTVTVTMTIAWAREFGVHGRPGGALTCFGPLKSAFQFIKSSDLTLMQCVGNFSSFQTRT
jgi:hypothetical protein